MERRDALGRRRQPTQSKGLRPLYPLLPSNVISRSIRIAMSKAAWARLEHATRNANTTAPRAIGEILERSLAPTDRTRTVVKGRAGARVKLSPDWQDWQIRKEKQLLREAS